tara:strand:+ start:552 stop:1076 length:525 start_codon:yes stop_codon:yes gene_type:complete
MKSHEKHRSESKKTLSISLITVSSSRYNKLKKDISFEDESYKKAVKIIKDNSHKVSLNRVIDDHIGSVRLELLNNIYKEKFDVIIFMGGTGLSSRDVTVEAVEPLLDKKMDGFSEIFRLESYKKVGTAAYLSRSIAGSIEGKLVFCLPGSPDAVITALKLILPELSHASHMANT